MTTCSDIVGMLDFHLDRELGAADTELVTRHLDTCDACSRLLAQRIAMRDRLRQAARDDASDLPPGLATRVRRSLAPASAADRWAWRLLPVAAAVILIVAGARWYRLQDSAGLSPPCRWASMITCIARSCASTRRVSRWRRWCEIWAPATPTLCPPSSSTCRAHTASIGASLRVPRTKLRPRSRAQGKQRALTRDSEARRRRSLRKRPPHDRIVRERRPPLQPRPSSASASPDSKPAITSST